MATAPDFSDHNVNNALPGEPLSSGFDFKPTSDVPEAQLSPEAQGRILAKMESVDEARLRAAQDGHTAYVG